MSGGGERITVASLLAGEGAQVVKSEDGQVKIIPLKNIYYLSTFGAWCKYLHWYIGANFSFQVQIHVYQGEDEENRGRCVHKSRLFLILISFHKIGHCKSMCSIRYYSEEASEGLEGYSDSSQGMPELEYRWERSFSLRRPLFVEL